MPERDIHEVNRASWNAATRAHNSHKRDQAAFFRDGGVTLFDEERELLGNIAGLPVAHLQCNAGQDTLSLANLGAAVTGVDISDEAIDFARALAAESGVEATFARSDVYDWFEASETPFDVVFSSYGAVCWLSDLKAWGRGIASVLKPGGRFVLVDFHPALMMFEGEWELTYDYMGGKAAKFDDGVGDYVAMTGSVAESEFVEGVAEFRNPHPVYEFAWGLADVGMALIEGGLELRVLREYPYCNGFKPFPDMRELPGRRFTTPEGMPSLAMMYGIRAEKG